MAGLGSAGGKITESVEDIHTIDDRCVRYCRLDGGYEM